MASMHMKIVIAIVMVLPVMSLAKTFIVGDDSGWKMGFNYQTWADGKQFRIGDKLVFRYPKGAHTVLKVDGDGFDACRKQTNNQALTSGNDVITLETLGKKWYICSVGKHCAGGQKLSITVTGKVKRVKRPSKSSAHGVARSWSQVLIIPVITAAAMATL